MDGNRNGAAPGFVVLREDGRMWDGDEWTAEMSRARRFWGGPDAWADCHLAVTCLRRLGHRCSVAALHLKGAAAQVGTTGGRIELPNALART